MIDPAFTVPVFLTNSPQQYVRFLQYLRNEELPTIDVEMLFSLIVDAVTMSSVADDCLSELANSCAYGEQLFSHTGGELTLLQKDNLFYEIIRLGEGVVEQLLEIQAYDNHGYFNYRLHRLAGAHAVYYTRR